MLRKIWSFVKFLWNHLCFAIRQVLIFGKHVIYVLAIIGMIVAILNGPGFAQSYRNDLEQKLEYAFNNAWTKEEVLDVHFKVEKAILFREEHIKAKVQRYVSDWNLRVKQEIDKEKAGFVISRNFPLHTVRSFYTDGVDGKGPTVWLVSDNVTDIPNWLEKNEIK